MTIPFPLYNNSKRKGLFENEVKNLFSRNLSIIQILRINETEKFKVDMGEI